jgi:hypothetical protein
MKEDILNIISILVGVIGVGQAVSMVYRQIVAERELSKRLRSKIEERAMLFGKNNVSLYNNTDININGDKLKELIEQVKQVVEEMPERKRGEILESLEQKSSKGQINYLNKLLHMSGSNVNISAHG